MLQHFLFMITALWNKTSGNYRSHIGNYLSGYIFPSRWFLLVLSFLLNFWRCWLRSHFSAGSPLCVFICEGIFLLQGNVSVQKYFITKRGIANGIFMSGGALGNMLMPIFLRWAHCIKQLIHRYISTKRFSVNAYGFQLTVLFHAAFISLTFLSALSSKPVQSTQQGVENHAFKQTEGLSLEDQYKEEKNNIKEISEKKNSKLLCGFIWIPNINQIFIWKVLKNPLFLVLTFSVITCRLSCIKI